MYNPDAKQPIALFLSAPFCPCVCPYCMQATLEAGDPRVRRAYIEALGREIESAAGGFDDCTVAAVWVGGGIAGHMFDEELGNLLRSLPRMFDMAADAEITCTVHPGMVSVETLNACRRGRVTRLAVEYETASPSEWATLGRFLDPSAMDTTSMVLGTAARAMLSLEFSLAVGIAGQTTASLRRSIDKAIAYGAAHITLQSVSPQSPACASSSDEERAQLLGFATAYLTARGFDQYLPLLFAQPGARCRYRELEAGGSDVLGFGLGARTSFAGVRATNTTDLDTYLPYADIPDVCVAEITRPTAVC